MKRPFTYCAVIGIDGMGNFNRFANTPNLDRLFENGAKTNFALSMDPTISAQNWGAMLLGLAPTVHGLTNGYISRYEYKNKAFPSLFTRIRQAFPDAYLASVCNWNPINHGLIEHDVGVDFATADNDEQLHPMILERIAKKPKFLFVQYDDVDGAGHAGGYGGPKHLRQIEISDGYIGDIFAAYEKAGILNETLVIVIADHGGVRHGHGGYTDEEKYVFFGLAGQDVRQTEIQNASTVDVAATVLRALGLPVPAYNPAGFSSQFPAGVFKGCWRKYVAPAPKPAAFRHAETPAFRSENGLTAFVKPDSLALAMFLDHNLKDETGQNVFREHGTVKYYSDGVNGACGEFGTTGCAIAADCPIGSGSFTVAVWLYVDRSVKGSCVICGNRSVSPTGKNASGFTLALQSRDVSLLLGSPEAQTGVSAPLPADLKNGWVHIIAAADAEKKEVRMYTNFLPTRTEKAETAFPGNNNKQPFAVGDDTDMKNNTETCPNLFRMDDLFVFRGAFGSKDVQRLAQYYGVAF